jgi:hypothetical protein
MMSNTFSSVLSDLALKNKKNQFSNGPQNTAKEGAYVV